MQMICVRACELPLCTQRDLWALCMAANMAGGTVHFATSTVTYDRHTNALIIIGQDAVRFQFDEPHLQYRWN